MQDNASAAINEISKSAPDVQPLLPEEVNISANERTDLLSEDDDDAPRAKKIKASDDGEFGNVVTKAKRPVLDSKRIKYDSICKECRAKYIELTPDQLVMYLHAYSYQVSG